MDYHTNETFDRTLILTQSIFAQSATWFNACLFNACLIRIKFNPVE